MPVAPFGTVGAQYLPAAAFQDERLWIAGYRSTAGNTRVLVSSTDDGRTFATTTTLASRPYGRSSLCGPHPPDCQPRQSFVGDYIGAVAAPGRVWVDFVLPAGPASSANRLFVATLETAP